MDSFILGEDIPVMCVPAAGFPDGIVAAHEHLHTLVPDVERRHFFGISAMNENGQIEYKAAAEELMPGETHNLGLQSYTIPRGAYMSFYIKDYRSDTGAIRRAFDLLLGQQEADHKTPCIEWYIGEDDVKCLVRSDDDSYPKEP